MLIQVSCREAALKGKKMQESLQVFTVFKVFKGQSPPFKRTINPYALANEQMYQEPGLGTGSPEQGTHKFQGN